ncbi:MAG: VWA domain-containing protein [Gammaproteobacteria bacterium]
MMFKSNSSIKFSLLQLNYCFIAAMLVFASSSGRADDTEIYMGTGTTDASETHPNVLFILDTSGSMNARDAGANKRTARMTVLKEAMNDLLTTLDNVNIGLARFSDRGGSMIFPVSPIDGNANIIVGEQTASKALEFKAVLVNESDDAEERVSGSDTGQVFLNDDVLEAFDFGGTAGQSGTTTIEVSSASDDISEFNRNGRMLNASYAYIHNVVALGLRFQGINIAQGTTIQNAFLDFTHRIRRTNRTNAIISGLDIANTTTFSNSSRDLSSRSTTSATVAWDGIPGGNTNTQFSSPDIASIVQEIVDRSDWSSGNAMGFKVFTTTGQRYPYSRNATSTRQPKLRIVVQAVAGTEGDDQLLALRFTDLRIPRGAKLTSAKLQVTNSAAGGSSSVTWRISAEQTDDSAALTTATNNLSSRKGSGTVVNWTVDGSTLNTAPSSTQCSVTTASGAANTCSDQFTEETNDISSVLEEVTNRSGWCGGNAITILVDASSPNSSQIRKLYSRDSSEAALAPKLIYSYMPQAGCMNSMESSQIASSGDDAEQFNDAYYGSRVNTIGNDLVLGDDTQNGNQNVGLRFTSVDVPQGVTVKEAHIEFRSKGTSTGTASYTIQGINADNIGQFTSAANDISGKTKTSASATWAMTGNNAEDDWDQADTAYQSVELKSIVQEIVNRSGWSRKNNMGFVITGTGTRIAESFDSDPSKAPRLVVKYDDSKSIPFKSTREVLKEKVKELPARGGTPIAGAMSESAKYWRGEQMLYGKNKGSYGQISHPGAYCLGPNNCPGGKATTSGGGYYGRGGSTDEFFVLNPSGCTKNNLGSYRCRNRKINGNTKYLSPIKTKLECAANHQVLLTDGQAGGNDVNNIKKIIQKNTCHKDNSKFKLPGHSNHKYQGRGYYGTTAPTAEACVPDLVEYMANNDQKSDIAGDQVVKTHTVAFALKAAGPVQFLKDVANLGGGGFYSADTAGDLQDVFKVILSDVRSAPTSFAAPSLATNAFNKLLSRDDVYFGMFTPELSQKWNGNVKKYKICISSSGCSLGEVLDANGKEIIDKKTDRFVEDAQSIWSDSKDGPSTTKGGAGGEITDHTEVVLLTDKKDNTTTFEQLRGTLLDTEKGYKLTAANWDDDEFGTMRSAICASPSTNAGSECEKRMLWLLGKKHITDAQTDINQGQRWAVGDVLHSSPVVITYGGSPGATQSGGTFIDKIVYGTNAGYLHMINGETGKEEWRYMPSDFWSMQRQLFDNRQDTHMYGLDSSPTLWACDVLGDGNIQPDARRDVVNLGSGTCADANADFVRVITATRRGGGTNGFIYALDVSASMSSNTDIVGPKFMWRIAGGNTTGDFRRLGQTWSQPRITTIMVQEPTGASRPKDVLIFGGGYDIKLDDKSKFDFTDNDGNDYLGNAIYIVDPMNGQKILSISGKGSGADIEVKDMHYSIPSRIGFLDSNTDGLTDRLYVGDLGGQVWRVDISESVPLTGTRSTGTVVGLLAKVSDGSTENRRRFFEKPSIVQVNDTTFSTSEEYDYVLIGSGNRSHPLEESVKDKFYAFRDRFISNNALVDSNGDGVSGDNDGYPTPTHKPYSHADQNSLLNVTTKGVATQAASDPGKVKASDGWFFDFAEANSGRPGEKALSSPLTAGGAAIFTTFDPKAESGANAQASSSGNTTSAQAKKNDPCSAAPNIGTARAYHINILTAEPPEITEVNGNNNENNRFREIIGSGIPSDVIPVFTQEGVIGIAQSDGRGIGLGQLSSTTPERAYWNESIEF